MNPAGIPARLFFIIVFLIQSPVFATPESPRAFLDTTYNPPTGGTIITVLAGGDFQAALDQAVPGDIIELEAGAIFTGPFILPDKGSTTEWIYIRSAAHGSLPSPGSRVTPSDVDLMPKIQSPSGTDSTLPAIITEKAAHHYRFVGIEIASQHSIQQTGSQAYLVRLECLGRHPDDDGLLLLFPAYVHCAEDTIDNKPGQDRLDEVPTDIVVDRCYIHGTVGGNVRRGIAMNSARTAVVDSFLSDFHETGADSQAIAGWNGPGPFKIVNNYLEGAGENMIFGGSDPFIVDLVPSDIEIRRNHFFKPFIWKIWMEDADPTTPDFSVKNIFELKNARRVLVQDNVFENNWADSQNGFAILFTVRNQEGNAPWSVVEDVKFDNNIVRHTAGGFNITGTDDLAPSQQTSRILIRGNLIYDVDPDTWRNSALPGGPGCCSSIFQLANVAASGVPQPDGFPGGIVDLTVDHNTGRISGSETKAVFLGSSEAVEDQHQSLILQNNLLQRGTRGVFGNRVGEGTVALDTYASAPWDFEKNVVIGVPSNMWASYPSTNQDCSLDPNLPDPDCFPADDDAVEFVDWRNDDYRLAASSPYKNAGKDGSDLGADIAALNAATEGVVSGSPPAGGDTTRPLVAITSPAGGATVSGIVTVAADASDNVAMAGVQFFVNGTPIGTEDTAAPFSVPWETTTVADGSHSLTAVARDTSGNTEPSDPVVITVSNGTAAQSPFTGTPFAIPGTFEAEDFDRGGEGVAYHDAVAGNAGGLYRPDEDVDIIAASGNASGYVVNNIETAEWLEYTIDVGSSGTYRIELHVSSEFATTAFHIEIDGTDVTGSVAVPNTGWWGTFDWIGKSGISLTAGQHVLRVFSDQQYFNLNAIRISAEGVTWTDLVNVTVTSGNTLKKIAGCGTCWDAGATSVQEITSGDGYAEFTATETTTTRALGLGNVNTDASGTDIEFAIALHSDGTAAMYESGSWVGDFGPSSTYATGDVFRIAVEGGVVKYYKNGLLGDRRNAMFPPVAPTYPLQMDTSLNSMNATISGAVISTGP